MHAALGEPVRLTIVDELVLGDASPGELAGVLQMPTNLLAFHLGVLDQAGIVRRVRSEGDRRRQYVQLRVDDPVVAALTRDAVSRPPLPRPRAIVFVCTANSARSQLALAVWHRVSDVPATSAGTRPAARVHPRAVATGRRHGLDLSGATTGGLPEATELDPDDDSRPLIVAVCDNAHEDLVRRAAASGSVRPWLHWHIPDPVPEDTDDAFEAAYAHVDERVHRLATAFGPLPAAS